MTLRVVDSAPTTDSLEGVVSAATFDETEAPPPHARSAYLDGLCHSQELWLEQRVSTGRTWSWRDHAYVVADDDEIVEFYAAPHLDQVSVFANAVRACRAHTMVCKSFDEQAITVASGYGATSGNVEDVGILFRSHTATRLDLPSGLTISDGRFDDVELIAQLDDGFFDDTSEIAHYLSHGGLVVAKLDGALVGCGLSIPVIDGRSAVDIGMWVAPAWRGRGFGASLVGAVAERVHAAGGVPIAGCDIANTASIRSLVRGGFAPDHRMMRFDLTA